MSTPTALELSRPARRAVRLPRLQELGLVLVILVIGIVLGVFGWRDAAPGSPNLFLNTDNLIDGIATPMSVYAIMAILVLREGRLVGEVARAEATQDRLLRIMAGA
jgi:hypothetical protein